MKRGQNLGTPLGVLPQQHLDHLHRFRLDVSHLTGRAERRTKHKTQPKPVSITIHTAILLLCGCCTIFCLHSSCRVLGVGAVFGNQCVGEHVTGGYIQGVFRFRFGDLMLPQTDSPTDLYIPYPATNARPKTNAIRKTREHNPLRHPEKKKRSAAAAAASAHPDPPTYQHFSS